MWNDLAATSADQEPHIDHYELLNTIGQGRFGKVMSGRHVLTGTEVAVKVIPQSGFLCLQRLLKEEVECVKALHHPNIVELFEVIDTPKSLFLVMEHMSGGDMMTYLKIRGRMTEFEARRTFRQLVSAMQYCHEKGFVHRDLKPQNVLYNAQMTAKIADFGLSTTYRGKKFSGFFGSRNHAAPELFLGKPYDGPPTDVWSLGVLLYRMVTATIPFKGQDLGHLKKRILSGRYMVPPYLSEEVQNLINKMITLNPEDRHNIEMIMRDPWLTMGPEEELRPYREPPREDMDPWVAEAMVNLGFQWDQIQEAIENKTYNNVMATYLLMKRKFKAQRHTIQVRPFRSPSPNSRGPSPAPAQDVQPQSPSFPEEEQQPQDHRKEEEPGGPPGSQQSSSATPPHNPGSRPTTPPPSPGSRSATPSHITTAPPERNTSNPPPSTERNTSNPPPSTERNISTPKPNPESRTTTPSPAPHCEHGGCPSSHSSSSTSKTPEKASQGWRGLARRCLNFLAKLCLRPCKKGRGKRNRVTPL